MVKILHWLYFTKQLKYQSTMYIAKYVNQSMCNQQQTTADQSHCTYLQLYGFCIMKQPLWLDLTVVTLFLHLDCFKVELVKWYLHEILGRCMKSQLHIPCNSFCTVYASKGSQFNSSNMVITLKNFAKIDDIAVIFRYVV